MLKKSTFPLRALVITAAIAMTAAACSSASHGSSANSPTGGGAAASVPAGVDPHPLAKRTTVTLAIDSPAEAYASFWVAKDLGEFQKENIDLEIKKVPSAEFVQAALTGQAEIVLPAVAGLFNAIASGADLRMVASAYDPDDGTGFYLSPVLAKKKPNFGPCDMKGLTVAVAPGATIASAAALPMQNYLSKCNLNLHDIKLSPLIGAASVEALQTGALDVSVEYTNLGAQAAEIGAKKIVPFPKDFQFAPYVFGPSLLNQPLVEAAVLRALVRTNRTYLQGDYHKNAKVLDVLSKYEGLPAETIAKRQALPFDPNLAINPENLVTNLQKVFFDYGGVLSYNKPLTVSQVVDFSVLDRVVSEK